MHAQQRDDNVVNS